MNPRSPFPTVAATAIALASTLVLIHAGPAAAAEPAAKSATKKLSPTAERGRYLVETAGCHDCHTPLKMGEKGPEPDMSRALSGHPEGLEMPPVPALPEGPWLFVWSATNTAIAGPWGVSFTANLTPDVDTGLGSWTARDFKATFRTGKRMGRGRDILPPMPIPAYNHFTDADLEAIFAYLQTVPAIKNRRPEPRPPLAVAPATPTATTAAAAAPGATR